ncbi:hypothetical protein GY14_18395 [Delftia tsuruhatensis]|jgi:hypothetical protein|uniref:hypothetical protein n=1 Tax=uncultured Delftia sp. TaxID=191464 RepID=UPI0004D80FEB|nr:hypothetical protein [uncultured Delftia sp.]KEH08624.1 hypothetical protein GY14_18395 [Delftia tsuruhatensis]
MLIDTSRFPLVYLREPEAQAPADAGNGNDASAEVQIESLLDQGRHFVLLTDHLPGDHPEENHEERKQRALFFKRNRERMRQLCRGMVVITGERAVPVALRLAVQGMGKALGMRVAFVQGEDEAQVCSWELLGQA